MDCEYAINLPPPQLDCLPIVGNFELKLRCVILKGRVFTSDPSDLP
jgi:hypothetical protein